MTCTVLPNDASTPEDTALAMCGAAELRSLKARIIALESGVGIISGMICMFSGAIPSGWVLCDGLNGTPDLRDRFVVAAGAGHPVNTVGGEKTHVMTSAEMANHQHSMGDFFTLYAAASDV